MHLIRRLVLRSRSRKTTGKALKSMLLKQAFANKRWPVLPNSRCAEQLTYATCSKLKVWARGSASNIRERPALASRDLAADSSKNDSKNRR